MFFYKKILQEYIIETIFTSHDTKKTELNTYIIDFFYNQTNIIYELRLTPTIFPELQFLQ